MSHKIEINSQDFEHVQRFFEYPPTVHFLWLKFFNLLFISLRCDGILCNGIIAEQFYIALTFAPIFSFRTSMARTVYVCGICVEYVRS